MIATAVVTQAERHRNVVCDPRLLTEEIVDILGDAGCRGLGARCKRGRKGTQPIFFFA